MGASGAGEHPGVGGVHPDPVLRMATHRPASNYHGWRVRLRDWVTELMNLEAWVGPCRTRAMV